MSAKNDLLRLRICSSLLLSCAMPAMAESETPEVAKDDQGISVSEVCDKHFADREECREVIATALTMAEADRPGADETTECASGSKGGRINCFVRKLEAKWPGAGLLFVGFLLISCVVWVLARIIPQKRD